MSDRKYQRLNATSNSATRRRSAVTTFLGVDYASQRFKVSQNRAIDLNNYVYDSKAKVIKKRQGVTQIFEFTPVRYVAFDAREQDAPILNTTEVNGLWEFGAEDGQKHVVAQIGRLLCELKNVGQENMSCEPLTAGFSSGTGYMVCHDCLEYEEEGGRRYKGKGFVGSRCFWFLTGKKFMLLRFLSDGTYRYEPVEDGSSDLNIPYIPTTTIGITYMESGLSQRAQLDDVNMLSQWRKNGCVTGTGKGSERIDTTEYEAANNFYDYPLDAAINPKNPSDMNDFVVRITNRGEVKY